MGKHARREPEPPHEQPDQAWPGPPQDPWADAAPHPPLDGWPHSPAPHPAEPVSPPPPPPPHPAAAEPVSPPAPPVFARASAPVGRAQGPLRHPTAELPTVRPRTVPDRVPGLRQPLRPSLRQLTFGWPMSVTGLFVAFIGWGVWAASVRGRNFVPILDFVIVLVVAVGLFAVSRLLGRHLLENLLRRPRRSARLAHAITGLFLCAAGVSFLSQTSWIIDGINKLRGFR